MHLKTQEMIRKLELIAALISLSLVSFNDISELNELYNFLENNNISLDDLKNVSKLTQNIYLLDVFASFRTQMGTNEYKELKKLYKEVITNTGDLINEFEFNDPISIFAMYIYMYRSGYLSNDKYFEYNTDMKDFSRLFGLDVIRGRGVCRSVASMLKDIYDEVGMNSRCMLVNTNGETIEQLEHLSDIPVIKSEKGKKFVKIVSTITKYTSVPNHMITAVSKEGKSYILDPMNDGLLYKGNRNKLVLANNPNYSMKNNEFMYTFYKMLGNLTGDKDVCNYNSISEEEYRTIYLKALKICKNNILMFEEFYKNNQEIYSEIYSKAERQKGFIKRLI